MGKNKFDENTSIIKNKTFYIALAICVVALGLSSYVTLSRLDRFDLTESTPTPSSNATSYSAVDQPVSNVSYPAESTPLKDDPFPPVTATDSPVEDDSVLVGAAPFFTMPVPGEVIKEFDPKALQYSETYKDWRLHLGVDLAAQKGAAVYACAQGTVEDIYNDPTLGTVVAIDHGEGIIAYYCGLNAKPVVKTGDQLESGTQIGVIDTIPGECVEQSHLHFYMEQDGEPVSPLEIINQ